MGQLGWSLPFTAFSVGPHSTNTFVFPSKKEKKEKRKKKEKKKIELTSLAMHLSHNNAIVPSASLANAMSHLLIFCHADGELDKNIRLKMQSKRARTI